MTSRGREVSKELQSQWIREINAEMRTQCSDSVLERAQSIIDLCLIAPPGFTEVYQSIQAALTMWGKYAERLAKYQGLI